MADQDKNQYSLVRFWRYIFTPLVLLLIGFAWYTIFNMSGTQLGVGGLTQFRNTLSIPSSSTIVSKNL